MYFMKISDGHFKQPMKAHLRNVTAAIIMRMSNNSLFKQTMLIALKLCSFNLDLLLNYNGRINHLIHFKE